MGGHRGLALTDIFLVGGHGCGALAVQNRIGVQRIGALGVLGSDTWTGLEHSECSVALRGSGIRAVRRRARVVGKRNSRGIWGIAFFSNSQQRQTASDR